MPESATRSRARGYAYPNPSLSVSAETLHTAVKQGNIQLTRLLLANGVDVNAVNEKQETALMIATSRGKETISRLLLDHGAKADFGDDTKKNTSSNARKKGYLKFGHLEKSKAKSKKKVGVLDINAHSQSEEQREEFSDGAISPDRSLSQKSFEQGDSSSQILFNTCKKVALGFESAGSAKGDGGGIETESEMESELEIDPSDFSDSDCTVSNIASSQVEYQPQDNRSDGSFEVIGSHDNSYYRSCANGSNRKRKVNESASTSSEDGSLQLEKNNGEDSGDELPSQDGNRRKRAKGNSSLGSDSSGSKPYACPYSKHDPREHISCTKWSNSSISRVKYVLSTPCNRKLLTQHRGHCLRTHLKPLQCPRCSDFRCGDNGQINKHLKTANCEKSDFTPIDQTIVRKGKDLARGKSRTWEEIYMVLFDCDRESVPSPCEHS